MFTNINTVQSAVLECVCFYLDISGLLCLPALILSRVLCLFYLDISGLLCLPTLILSRVLCWSVFVFILIFLVCYVYQH